MKLTASRRRRHRCRSGRISRRDPARATREEGRLLRPRRGRRSLLELGLHSDQSAAARRRGRSPYRARGGDRPQGRQGAKSTAKASRSSRPTSSTRTSAASRRFSKPTASSSSYGEASFKSPTRTRTQDDDGGTDTIGATRRRDRDRLRADRRQGVAARRRDDHQLRRRRAAASAFPKACSWSAAA